MIVRYFDFQCVGGYPTNPAQCTTRWPDTVGCSIMGSGMLTGTFHNVMQMNSELGTDIDAWLTENTGKVTEINYTQATNLVISINSSVQPTSIRIISKYSFMNRFTLNELVAIKTATNTYPDPTTMYTLQVLSDKLQAASQVDLDNPDIQSALDMFISLGLLGASRKSELLQDGTINELP